MPHLPVLTCGHLTKLIRTRLRRAGTSLEACVFFLLPSLLPLAATLCRPPRPTNRLLSVHGSLGNKRRGPGRPANRYRARQPDDSLRAPPPHPPAATGAASRSNDNDANVPAHDKPVELSQTEQTTLHLLEAFERFKEVRPPPKKKAGTSLPMFLGEPDRSEIGRAHV